MEPLKLKPFKITAPMVNREDTNRDVPGSGEHTNALGVPSTSLTEATPDPIVAQGGKGIVAEPSNVGDGEAPAQLNLPVGGLAVVVAPAPAHDAANVGEVAIAAAPHGNPVAELEDGVEVIANAVLPVVGAHNAGVAPADGVGAHNAVMDGAPPRAVHANGVAHVGGAAIAPAPFDVGGNAVALAQAGAGVIANAVLPFVGAHNASVAPADGVGAHNAGVAPADGVGAHNAGVAPAGGVGAHNAVIGGAPPRAGHANGAGGAAMALAALGVGGNAVALAQAGAGLIANGGGAPAGQAPVHPYFDLDAGLSGPPLRRSEVGPFF